MVHNNPKPYNEDAYNQQTNARIRSKDPELNKETRTQYNDFLSERHKRLLKKDDFIELGKTAKLFREAISSFEFRPNLFWGEQRDILKEKPDLFTELIACLGFFHALEGNLDNFYNNLGAVLINGGHINLFDDYHVITDKDSPYREAYLEFYNSIIKSAEKVIKKNPNLNDEDRESIEAYFYEYFLEAYDKQLRTDLGVWYTPDPIVNFINNLTRYVFVKHFPNQRPTYFDYASGTGVFIIDMIIREYHFQKDYMTPRALKWHLFNMACASELNDMSFLILFYNVNKTIYTLLGEWRGEIPVFDLDRPYFLPLINGNTLSLEGTVPALTYNKKTRWTHDDPNNE